MTWGVVSGGGGGGHGQIPIENLNKGALDFCLENTFAIKLDCLL